MHHSCIKQILVKTEIFRSSVKWSDFAEKTVAGSAPIIIATSVLPLFI